MRKTVVLIAALVLILSLGVSTGAQQTYNPQNRQKDPRFQRNDQMRGDRRTFVGQLSVELVRHAETLAQASFQYYMGWNGVMTDSEQAVLFKTEEFAAAARLFGRLALDGTDYLRPVGLRTNLFTASRYVALAFRQLEEQMRMGGVQNEFNRLRRDGRQFQWQPQSSMTGPWGPAEIRRLLDRIELEFTNWQ